MRSILIIFLIFFALSSASDERGSAYNLKHPDSERSCRTVAQNRPNGVSDCADSLLWVQEMNRYYDRCCYIMISIKWNYE